MALDFFDQIDESPLTEKLELPGKGGKAITVYAVTPPQRDLEHIKMQASKRARDLDDGEWDPESAALMVVACIHEQPNNESALVFKEKDLGRLVNMPAHIIEPMADACERVCKRDYKSRKNAKKNSEGAAVTAAPST